MTNNEIRQKLTNILTLLDIPGIGRGRYHNLIKKFGSPQKVLDASINELKSVPGSPDFKMSEGTNRLIQSGAKLITGINDIFKKLPRLKGVVKSKQFEKKPDMTKMEKKIVDLIAEKLLQVDNIS